MQPKKNVTNAQIGFKITIIVLQLIFGKALLAQNADIVNIPAEHPIAVYGDNATVNKISIGPALMRFKTNTSHYKIAGVMAEFSHFLNDKVGLTINIAYFHRNFNSINNLVYNHYIFTGGITYEPFNTDASPFIFYIHALAGYTSYKTDVTVENNSNTINASSLTFALGFGSDYYFNKYFGLGLLIDYAPTFFYKTTQNNYTVAARFSYNF